MGAKEDKENIEELYPKPKVVILAEDPTETGNEEHPIGFPSQAFTWAKDHPEFDVHVYPFYKGWKGNEMRDVVNKIDLEVEGNFDIAFMGHSGNDMGGVPISEHATTRARDTAIERKGKTLARRVLEGGNEFPYHMKDDPQKNWQNTDDSYDNYWNTDDESLTQINRGWKDKRTKKYVTDAGVEDMLGAYTENKTIADYINIDLGDRVKEVIVGGCSQGKGKPAVMQSLASETGKNVTCQYSGSWGTEAITKTGDSPKESFFVSGKYKEVGAIEFKPVPEDLKFIKPDPADRSWGERIHPKMSGITEEYDPEMLEERKQIDKSRNRHHRINARELTQRAQWQARKQSQLLENIQNPRKLPENVEDWTVDDILYEQWNIEHRNPRSIVRLIDIMGIEADKEYGGAKATARYVHGRGIQDYKEYLDDLLYEIDYVPEGPIGSYEDSKERPEDNYYSNPTQRMSSEYYIEDRQRKRHKYPTKKQDLAELARTKALEKVGKGEEETTTDRTVGSLSDYLRQYD